MSNHTPAPPSQKETSQKEASGQETQPESTSKLILLLAHAWFHGDRVVRFIVKTPARVISAIAEAYFLVSAFLLVLLRKILPLKSFSKIFARKKDPTETPAESHPHLFWARFINWQNGSLVAVGAILFLTGFAWHNSPEFSPSDQARSNSDARTQNTKSTHENLIPEGKNWRLIETESLAQLEVLEQDRQLEIIVTRGDTLSKLLIGAGIKADESDAVIEALNGVYNLRKLRVGQHIVLRPIAGNSSSLRALFFDPEPTVRVQVLRTHDNRFHAERSEKVWSVETHWAEGEIQSSLYLSAVEAKVPLPVLARMIHIFSFTIDFQRDIRPGDGFSLFYETWNDEQGKVIGNGDLLYGELILRGKRHTVWAFHDPNEGIEYFDSSGRSSRKGLMRTPIDGARLSSSYGMRKHPILGFNRMHQGVDFAAPTGTPIYAAGNGVIEAAGRNGGYGHYIRIRHAGDFKTAYAHLSAYAAGIKRGAKVSQGQVIGFVGSTGRSTGPHLHYEILRGGKHVNPSRVALPSGRDLRLGEMQEFERIRARTFALIQKTRGDKKIVSLQACDAAFLHCENAPPPRIATQQAQNYDAPPTGPGGWPSLAPPIKPRSTQSALE